MEEGGSKGSIRLECELGEVLQESMLVGITHQKNTGSPHNTGKNNPITITIGIPHWAAMVVSPKGRPRLLHHR